MSLDDALLNTKKQYQTLPKQATDLAKKHEVQPKPAQPPDPVQEAAKHLPKIEDSVTLSKQFDASNSDSLSNSFVWKKDSGGELDLDNPSKENFFTTILAKTPSATPKYAIQFGANIVSLKEKYIQNFVQSKSPNLLLSKFAEFKCAVYLTMLSVVGFPRDELIRLQKKAIQDAQKDNMTQFDENEYNFEMLELLSPGKSGRKNRKVLEKIQTELKIHMAKLGWPEYYSDEKILQIRMEQLEKMTRSFESELQKLSYQREYYYGK